MTSSRSPAIASGSSIAQLNLPIPRIHRRPTVNTRKPISLPTLNRPGRTRSTVLQLMQRQTAIHPNMTNRRSTPSPVSHRITQINMNNIQRPRRARTINTRNNIRLAINHMTSSSRTGLTNITRNMPQLRSTTVKLSTSHRHTRQRIQRTRLRHTTITRKNVSTTVTNRTHRHRATVIATNVQTSRSTITLRRQTRPGYQSSQHRLGLRLTTNTRHQVRLPN